MKKNILIYGAGIAGEILKNDIDKNHKEVNIIGFIDDNSTLEVNILGKIDDTEEILSTYKIDEIIISIPSANGALIRKILLNNLNNRIPIKLIPRNSKIIGEDSLKYIDAKYLDIEDILGRSFIKKDIEILKKCYIGKTIFITGGAGSIGSEIVYQLLDLGAKKVIVYDNSEYLIFNLDQRLKERNISTERYKLVIGNILNTPKLKRLIDSEKPDVIFHAGAYKHVYLMEDNIDEAIINNVVGTKNVVDIAIESGVKNFVFISTDKVVNPTSIMGATKKLGEFYIKSKTDTNIKFNIVRFGNVINSNGSVLPLFEYQIKNYKYLTITHKDVMRYFMSIREAAQLVISCVSRESDGEIYILDMGELININDIALSLIRSKNLLPDIDIKINFIGLKKGEKLIEELFTQKELQNLTKTEVDNVLRLKNHEKCVLDINDVIFNLEKIVQENKSQDEMKKYFCNLFPSLSDKEGDA